MKKFNKIFFDYDSTLIKCEALDLLGEVCGVGEEVKKMTKLSMDGKISFGEVFSKKVDLMAPSKSQVEDLAKRCVNLLVDDAKEVVEALEVLGKHIFILTSNFYELVYPIADALNISCRDIIANNMYFDEKGKYAGMSKECPLSQSGGKKIMLEKARERGDVIAFIGDSASDLKGQEVADLFIGFGGVVEREAVKNGADMYFNTPSLAPLLLMLLSPEEVEILKQKGFGKILTKAYSLTVATEKPSL